MVWPTTPAFTAALGAGTRRWATKVDVLLDGVLMATVTGIKSGQVTVDDTAVRRTLDLTLVDPTGALTPAAARDLLSPRGAEVRPWRGLWTGTEHEWVPLGVFGVIDPVVEGAAGGTEVTLSGRDRVDAVSRRRFTAPYPIKAGTPTHTAITGIVTTRLNVPVRVTPTGNTVPETVFDALDDPWEAVRDLAEADSMTAYFDALGALVVAPDEPAETGLAYEAGPGSLLVTSTRSMSAEHAYSGVIVLGEHPDHPPVRAERWNTDTRSATYAYGPFGPRPYGFTSQLIATQAQAELAASTIFARVTRLRQEVEAEVVGHPGHDVGDVVRIVDLASRTLGEYVLTGATIPLRPGVSVLRAKEV